MDNDIKNYINKAINNDNNKCLLDLSSKKIKERKLEIINELDSTKKYKGELLKKLNNYRYIDEIPELHIGTHIRWIKLNEDNQYYLTNGAILVDILFEDETILLLKNNFNKFFKIYLSHNLIFQKLTNQEIIILYALDNIDKIK